MRLETNPISTDVNYSKKYLYKSRIKFIIVIFWDEKKNRANKDLSDLRSSRNPGSETEYFCRPMRRPNHKIENWANK